MATQTSQHSDYRTVHCSLKRQVLSSMPPCNQMNKAICGPPASQRMIMVSSLPSQSCPHSHPETQLCSHLEGHSPAVEWRRQKGVLRKNQWDLERAGEEDRNIRGTQGVPRSWGTQTYEAYARKSQQSRRLNILQKRIRKAEARSGRRV